MSASGTPVGEGAGRGAIRRCPICGKPAAAPFLPFCSKRCTEVDLHRWLSGRYAIPASPEEGEESGGEGGAADDDTPGDDDSAAIGRRKPGLTGK